MADLRSGDPLLVKQLCAGRRGQTRYPPPGTLFHRARRGERSRVCAARHLGSPWVESEEQSIHLRTSSLKIRGNLKKKRKKGSEARCRCMWPGHRLATVSTRPGLKHRDPMSKCIGYATRGVSLKMSDQLMAKSVILAP